MGKPVWEKLESLYVDDEPLDEEGDDEDFSELVGTMENTYRRGEAKQAEILEQGRGDIEALNLRSLAGALAAGGSKGSGHRSHKEGEGRQIGRKRDGSRPNTEGDGL